MRPSTTLPTLAGAVAIATAGMFASPGTPSFARVDHVAAAPAARVPADAEPHDPYAALWHCREEVRRFLSVSTESHARRLAALEDCVAAAERSAEVEIAGD
jgi:hypothetical protein